MKRKVNPRQLVLRRDTATGLTLVGWDEDLPVRRFEHLELIGESASNTLPECGSEFYAAWQSALLYARQANQHMLQEQVRHNQEQGWMHVPFELASNLEDMMADDIGNYASAAMRLQYQLTQNRKQVWAVIQQKKVIHLRARYPLRELDEFTYQVWYHQQLHQLNEMGGSLLEGNLNICESGLWFEAI